MKILFSSLLALSFAASFAVASTPPIKSKEEIDFMSPKDEPMMSLLSKNPDFSGVITRTAEANPNLQVADLYAFKNISEVKMTKEVCTKILEKIYGPIKEISLKVRNINIYSSHTGNTCEAQIDNDDSKAKIPERRTVIGFLNAQPYALVFKFAKKSTPAEQAEVKKFWDSLR